MNKQNLGWRRYALWWCLILWAGSAVADYTARPEVADFIKALDGMQGAAADRLQALFARIDRQDRVLALIARPAEAKPWHDYREIFVTPSRIHEGVVFWRRHTELLAAIASQQGVPAEVIVAIVGIETAYGRNTGGFPVLATLTTLAFDYPPRADFFRKELREFLLLTEEEGLVPLEVQGSYAGAMGIGQFMPSSYRHYAIDFDQDGRRDLWGSPGDALASVGHYLAVHGWQAGLTIAVKAEMAAKSTPTALLERGLKPSLSLDALRRHQVHPMTPLPKGTEVALVALDGVDGVEYWLGTANFYAITRYNRSPLYAMAVTQLAAAIAAERDSQ